ncbi:MAG: HAD-IA family hydrolase [Syntrophales bacterium]|nr:HAD-IA family hydrolase [Syntrophales bacterium]
MKAVDLLIFDLDGTLAATGDDLVNSVNHALKMMGYDVLAPERIISFVGDGIHKLMERCLGRDHEDVIDEAIRLFNNYYSEHILDHTVLYPGVVACLEHFHNKKKIVISNKSQSFVEVIVEKLGIKYYFNCVIGGDTYPYQKPDLRLVTTLLAEFGTEAERTVVIGDGVNDIMLAKNAGVSSCSFLGGLTKREILLALRPDFVCENMEELSSLFE